MTHAGNRLPQDNWQAVLRGLATKLSPAAAPTKHMPAVKIPSPQSSVEDMVISPTPLPPLKPLSPIRKRSPRHHSGSPAGRSGLSGSPRSSQSGRIRKRTSSKLKPSLRYVIGHLTKQSNKHAVYGMCMIQALSAGTFLNTMLC